MPISDPLHRPPRVENEFTTSSPDPSPRPDGQEGGEKSRLPLTDHLTRALAGSPAHLPDIPGYRLLEVIGRGGMATVYRAVHLAAEREVALKLMHAAGLTEAAVRRRFEREVRTLAHLEHPNVVPVYDVGVWQGFPFYTMKYLPRGPLEVHIERLRHDLPAACRLLAKVARAVHHVHAAGVVHRDLKPENILLDDGDEPLVADFSLAVDGDGADLTASGVPIGTRLFMAPEQTAGRKDDYGPATDVWALGVILYELLTGRYPFEDGDCHELYRRIRDEEPAPPSALNPACPPELAAVARRCLAKRPCDRYPTAAAVAADLERWMAGRPVHAVGVPAARRPFGSALLVVGLLAAVFGAAALLAPGPPHSPAAARPTVADRLARGEAVVLIGPTGEPAAGPKSVPGAAGLLSTDRDGFCTLASLRFAAADLVHEEIPLPVRLEAELAISRGDGPQSWAAVYVGRKESPGSTGVRHSQAQVALMRTRTPRKPGGVDVSDTLLAEALWWTPAAGAIREDVGQVAADRWEPAAFPAPLVWHRVAVTLDPDRAVVRSTGREVGAIRAEELVRLGDGFGRHGWLPGGPAGARPAFGPGIGVSVNNAEAVYRNVRLAPVAGSGY